MTISTVSIVALQSTGQALPNGRVTLELTAMDIVGGMVAHEPVTVVLDANGLGSCSLIANASGTQGTQYRVTFFDKDSQLQWNGMATIPATASCNLHDVLNLTPPPALSDAQAAQVAAQGYAAQASTQAGIATSAANTATGAAGTATTASGQAVAAAASAAHIIAGTFDPAALPTTRADGSAVQAGDVCFGTDGYEYAYIGAAWVNQTAAAAASAAASSSNAAAALASQTAAGVSQTATASSSAASNASANQAIAAAATAGVYPNAAVSNVPRGLTQASVGAITGGATGTNGTFNLSWSGGNFTVNPTGTFTVSGGAVTAVTITGPGLYIGASPTVPTPSFSASAGLVGAAVALTAQFLVTSGQGYWVASADGKTLVRYKNVSGTATIDSSSVPSVLTSQGAVANLPSAYDERLWNYATDSGLETGKSFSSGNSTPNVNANGVISGYIAVQPNTQYRAVGYRSVSNIYCGFYDASLNPINATNSLATGLVTTPANCYFLRLGLSFDATEFGYGVDQYQRVVFLSVAATPGAKAWQNPYPYHTTVHGETSIDGYLKTSPLTKSLVTRLGANLFNYQAVSTNVYIDTSGGCNFTSDQYAVCSPFIEVTPGLAYSLGGITSQPSGWAFFDENYTLCAGGSGVAYGFTLFGINRTAPASAKYVRFQLVAFNAVADGSANYRSAMFNQGATVAAFAEYTETAWGGVAAATITTTPLTGKKIVAFGDSITEATPCWYDYLVSKTAPASTSSKHALSGRQFGQFLDDITGQATAATKMTGANYLLVLGGANHRAGPFGTVSDTTQNKTGDMVQQLNWLVANIRLTNATAPIIFVIPPTGTTDSATALAALEGAYSTLISWCEDRHYMWLGLWHDFPRSKIFPSARYYMSNVTGTATWLQGDGTHPSTKAGGGHEISAGIVVDLLAIAHDNGVL